MDKIDSQDPNNNKINNKKDKKPIVSKKNENSVDNKKNKKNKKKIANKKKIDDNNNTNVSDHNSNNNNGNNPLKRKRESFENSNIISGNNKKKIRRNKKQKLDDNSQSYFVGQLPYTISSDGIKHFFESKDINVTDIKYMLDKNKKFKGYAFVHVSKDDINKMNQLHKTFLNGRQITVLIDNKGSSEVPQDGKSDMKIIEDKANMELFKRTKDQILEILSKCGKKVTIDNFDHKAIQSLSTFPPHIMKKVVEEYASLNFAKVRNKNAYLIGMLKKQREKLK